jgi:Spy/CpxP family protein refolding chaperone
MRRAFLAIVAATFVLTTPAEVASQAPTNAPNRRAAVQGRIRERFVRLLRDRVGLSDEQLRRLAPVSQSFEGRRQALFREERAARQSLRRELSAGAADQTRVAAQIDQLFALQRRRLDLAAEEQRELAAFMTPVQRARYLALQEHLRRRAEEMRRRRGDGPPRGARRGSLGGSPPF